MVRSSIERASLWKLIITLTVDAKEGGSLNGRAMQLGIITIIK